MTSLSRYKKYLIFILPLLFLIAGIIFNRAKYVNDPDYIYIVNALVICDGHSVGHVDNPGTTVMQIAAAIMAVMHLFSNPENETLINHVLGNPDKFVEGIRLVFVFINTLVLFLLGWITFKKTKSIWAPILLQITCFISANALDHVWSKVSPEPMLFAIVGIYVITVIYYYFEEKKE
ncbi:MAG: hypothetical protein JXP36_17970, partial [Bacteroidales bacterium]|nr:hypothetical protein [Bacteroidales bacterium]